MSFIIGLIHMPELRKQLVNNRKRLFDNIGGKPCEELEDNLLEK